MVRWGRQVVAMVEAETAAAGRWRRWRGRWNGGGDGGGEGGNGAVMVGEVMVVATAAGWWRRRWR